MAARGNDGDREEKTPDFISTLPRDHRWGPLCQYGGFWHLEFWMPGTLAVQSKLVTRPDDIFLASFPKSGTTWLKALAFSIAHRHRHSPSHPHHPLRVASPHDCIPFLEETFSANPNPDINALPTPTIWSNHMPYSALPASVRESNCRIVYIIRDPKDAFVSLLHVKNTFDSAPLAMDEAFEMFCSGICPYGPMWEHAQEYRNESLRRPEKVLFLSYEEMKGEPVGTLKRLADFLGYPFSQEEEREGVVEEISDLCSFKGLTSMAVNKEGEVETLTSIPIQRKSFFRRGEVGDWKNHLTPEMAERVDKITNDKLSETGLKLS